MLASYATARSLSPETANQTTFFLVQLRPGFEPDQVAREIADNSALPRYTVWTSQAFSKASQTYWLLESGAGIGSGFASICPTGAATCATSSGS